MIQKYKNCNGKVNKIPVLCEFLNMNATTFGSISLMSKLSIKIVTTGNLMNKTITP